MSRRTLATCSMIALAVGCNDIVIGTFPLGASGDGTSAATSDSDDATDTSLLPLPGGCVEEAFDATLAEPWITWADGGSSITANAGVLTVVPSASPEVATGLVLDRTHAFGFAAARVQVEVLTPPDPTSESELFLQVVQAEPMTSAVLSIALYQNSVRVTAHADDGTGMMSGPVAAAYPRWIAIRTEAGVVYFESSDDGVAWTTLSSTAQPAAFLGATPLVMVWNNPSAAAIDPQPVVVDNFSICAE